MLETLRRDSSASAWLAGLIAVLISYAGPLVIVFQAARQAGLSTELTSSWIWAISIGSGLSGLFLSWRLKTPVITAWSTPGAALLVTALPGLPLAEAVGAFIVSAALITVIGYSGLFDRLIARIPAGLAAAMLAGVLFRFGASVFSAVPEAPGLVLAMFGVYLLAKRWLPRYAIALVMLIGLLLAVTGGRTHLSGIDLYWVQPHWTLPQWSWQTAIGLGLPLALVTLTGQHMPGMAVLRTAGYTVPAGPIVGGTGLVSLLLAPFGSHGVNLAAITAAICTGKEAHEQASRRYVAGIACGLIYLLIGSFGGALALLFAALPAQMIATLAGLALVGAIGGSLATALKDDAHREASVLTFLATASGMSFLGLGSAFWGLVAGGSAYALLQLRRESLGSLLRARAART